MLQSIKQKQEAKKELTKFIGINKVGIIAPTKKLKQILPQYGIMKIKRENTRDLLEMRKIIKEEIKKGDLVAENVENRINEFLTQKYGEPITQEEANKRCLDYKLGKGIDKEKELEQKFNISFEGKKWFKCSIEEERKSTFSNDTRRDFNDCYVIIGNNYIELIKESVFLKSNMGARKIYFENITSIDKDNRGKLHLSNSVMINTKSGESAVQLKYVQKEDYELLVNAFDEYMGNKTSNIIPNSKADDLLKYAELFEKGLLTEEEFEAKKKELL